MKSIPLNEETSLVATHIIWFEAPAKALSDPVRFMAYAMTYAMHSKMGRYRPPPLPLRRFGDITGPDKLEFVKSHEGD
jgi:hypothetical protein